MSRHFLAPLAVCIFCAPVIAEAQDDLDAAADRQRVLVGEIERIQAAEGPLSAELIEPLTALALFYEEVGDEAPALATTERTLQLVRANFGLYSIEQVPILWKLRAGALANGDHLGAWNLEQELIEIARRHPSDLRTVEILRDVGDGRVDLLGRFIAGDDPPEVVFGCYYAPPGLEVKRGCISGSLSVAAAAILNDAHDRYVSAIEILRDKDLIAGDEIREFEMDIVRSSYTFGKYLGGTNGCTRAYESLDRLHEYDVLANAPLEVRAASFIRSADYRLVCEWNARALNMYQEALAMLDAEDASQSLIDEFFAPAEPIDLPTFISSPLDAEPQSASAPYVDVRFAVTRFGTTQNVKLVDGESRRDAADILARVRHARFRPYVRDGEFVKSPRFVVRYYLEDQ